MKSKNCCKYIKIPLAEIDATNSWVGNYMEVEYHPDIKKTSYKISITCHLPNLENRSKMLEHSDDALKTDDVSKGDFNEAYVLSFIQTRKLTWIIGVKDYVRQQKTKNVTRYAAGLFTFPVKFQNSIA